MTPYREIVNCAAAGFYEWHGGKVRFTRLFQPVESRPSARVETVGEAIETQVARHAGCEDVDVWCSGGLDSSIMAIRCNAEGRHADLLTLVHGGDSRSRT
jgi:asparagine synthetase B (glutamine-hydrolysing)